MAGLRPPEADIGFPGEPGRGRLFVLLGIFALLVCGLALLDRVGLQSGRTPQAVVVCALALFCLVALAAHGRRPADHYVAGHTVPPALGGLASAAGMAGLAIIGLAGDITPSHGEILTLILGLLFGLLIQGGVIAPRLRASGGYSAGDFLAERFDRLPTRPAAAAVALLSSGLLLVAALKAAAPIVSLLFGTQSGSAPYIIAGLAILILLPGGSRSLAWTQAIQTVIIAAVTILAIGILNIPAAEPDASAASGLAELRSTFTLPTQDRSLAGLAIPVLLVAAGAASLPTLCGRALSARSRREAGLTMGWAALFSLLLVAAGLALGAFLASTSEVQLAGLLAGDLFQQATLFAALPSVLAALLIAAALSALLAVAQAALLAGASALSHDFWDEMIDRAGPAGRRIVVARLSVAALAIAAAWFAPKLPLDAAGLLGWSLGVAAAGHLVPLVLGLWWARCTALAGSLGLCAGSAVAALILAGDLGRLAASPDNGAVGEIGPLSAAGLGMAAALAVAVTVSLLRPDPYRRALGGAVRSRRRDGKVQVIERPA